MKKQTAQSLRFKANEVAQMFSNKNRGGNVLAETFVVERIVVLSEVTAAVVFAKEPTQKKAAAFFYWINSKMKPRWEYFFVTYNHLMGLDHVTQILHDIEQHNFQISVGVNNHDR